MESKLASSSRRRGGGLFGGTKAKASQGRGAAGKQTDSSILRGAELIRQQIRKQLEEEDAFRKSREVRDTLLEGSMSGSGNSSKKTRSFSSDDEHEDDGNSTLFSDPWVDNNAAPRGARRAVGDSSTVLREASHSVCTSNSAGLGMSDMSAAASRSASPPRKRFGAGSRADQDLSPPPPPPPPPSDYEDDDGECYTPLSTIRRENSQQRGGVRILKVSRRGSSGGPSEDEGSNDGTYGFVGEDYDSELELDDQVNSGAVDSYLPSSLRSTKGGKSWSPNAVSKVDSAHESPFKPGIVPRRLQLSSPSSEPSISVKAKAPSKESSTALRETTSDDVEQSSHRHSLHFWSRLSSGGRSKVQRNRHSPQPSTHRLISPTASEKTDRLELSLNQRRGRAASDLVPSPLSVEYEMMMHDPAFCHAKNAGLLWQSLVGQQVRFPTTWWNGARGPPMGIVDGDDAPAAPDAKWEYFGRTTVNGSRHLNRLVPNRGKPGRLLLHMVVLEEGRPVADAAVGVYHPSARGIRPGESSARDLDRARTLWIALRKRSASCALLELPHMQDLFPERGRTPLENRKRITNQNMRAVYGDQAPLETLFVPQQELELRLARPDPILALVREFVLD
jgi:hypothetical protein